MVSVIFLGDLCWYVWVNILALSPPRVFAFITHLKRLTLWLPSLWKYFLSQKIVPWATQCRWQMIIAHSQPDYAHNRLTQWNLLWLMLYGKTYVDHLPKLTISSGAIYQSSYCFISNLRFYNLTTSLSWPFWTVPWVVNLERFYWNYLKLRGSFFGYSYISKSIYTKMDNTTGISIMNLFTAYINDV